MDRMWTYNSCQHAKEGCLYMNAEIIKLRVENERLKKQNEELSFLLLEILIEEVIVKPIRVFFDFITKIFF